MNKFSNYSLTKKLWLTPLVAIFGFGAYLLYSSSVLSAGSGLIKDIRDHDIPILEAANQISGNNDALVVALNTASTTGELEFLNTASGKAAEILTNYEKLESIDVKNEAEIKKLKFSFNAYFKLASDIAQQLATRSGSPTHQQILNMRSARDDYFRDSLKYKNVVEVDFKLSVSESIVHSDRAKTVGALIGTIMLAIILFLSWLAMKDISEKATLENSLRITSSVFDNTQEAILITDAARSIIEVNPAFTLITGYSHDEVIGLNPKLLSSGRHDKEFYAAMWNSLNEHGSWRGEIWNRRKSGDLYPGMLSITELRDNTGKVVRYVAVFSDISKIKEHEAELSRIAHFDALTGIPNRVLLVDRMNHAISQTLRGNSMMAICYLDLDGFKKINDTLGHEAGDEVLIEVTKRIGNTIRGVDTVARLGGDEFVVLLLDLQRGEECASTLERMLISISKPIQINSKFVSVSASIGVSIYPLDDENPDMLLRHADQAMYTAKQSGKNRFHIFDTQLDKQAHEQNEIIKSISLAIEQNQFELYYQPKINLLTKKLIGVEALIRWQHPEQGLLPPSEFLRRIENTHLDIEIGEWVIATALAQLNNWCKAGLDIEVSVNISGYHLESPAFLDNLTTQLMLYPDLSPNKFQIEILETVALNDIKVIRGVIDSCHKLGVGFALDDFGTGYSSLTYLSNLPVDVLKIDRSFVHDMLEDEGNMAIVNGIIALARALKRHTVAEGIETEEHFRMLREMGCELGQGYCIARPMPASDLIQWQLNYC